MTRANWLSFKIESPIKQSDSTSCSSSVSSSVTCTCQDWLLVTMLQCYIFCFILFVAVCSCLWFCVCLILALVSRHKQVGASYVTSLALGPGSIDHRVILFKLVFRVPFSALMVLLTGRAFGLYFGATHLLKLAYAINECGKSEV